MADSTIPNLVAVSVPALTDLFGVRQSGDARDKKLTATQLLSLAGDVFKVGTPSAGLFGVWTGDGTIEAASEVTLGGGVLVLNPGTETRVTGDLKLQTGSGQAPMLRDVAADETTPSLCPAVADANTGIGWKSGDRLAFIAGGKRAMVLAESNSIGVIPAYDTGTGLTAFAGGGQGSAITLDRGYNVVTTVATTADSAKLPTGLAFLVGSVVYLKNNGVNSLDLFPGSGDDLGAGVDTAIAVAAGASVAFIGTTEGSIWTQLIFAAGAGGGGDVTKVGTPVDNQIGVWTGDGTIEGDANFTWDGAHLLLPSLNDAATPTLAFGDGDTGLYEAGDDTLKVAVGGSPIFKFVTTTGGQFAAENGNGPGLRNVSSTSGTVASINPRIGDPNTGIGNAGDDRLSMIAGGVMGIRIIESVGAVTVQAFGAFTVTGNILCLDAAGPMMLDEVASATNPTVVPNRADTDTGIGWNAADSLSLIAGGIEIARAVEDTVEQFIISPGAILGSAALPSLAFGDGDSGFRESVDDALKVTLVGVDRWTFTADRFVAVAGNGPSLQNEASTATNPTIIPALGDVSTGIGGVTSSLSLIVGGAERIHLDTSLATANTFTGDWKAATATGPALIDEAASGTNPTLVPTKGDEDTGIGSNGADTLSLIAGGVEMLRLEEGTTDQVLIGPAGTAADPALSFIGDNDTGFYSAVPGILAVSVDGVGRFRFVGAQFRGATGGSPSLQNEVASASNPTILPTQADLDTGIGWTATDHLSLVAGGLDCINIRETASARQIGFYTTAPISLQTGVAVTAGAIHAALVALGLITA